MKFLILSYIIGYLVNLLGFFLLIFSLVGYLLYPNEGQGLSFLYAGFCALAFGSIGQFIGRDFHSDQITFREGLAVAGLGYIILAFMSSLPFFFTQDIPNFTNAFFESMSGLTTTGASILSNIEGLGHTTLLWRSFLHWLGGMGIIVLTLALLPALGIHGLQLYRAEVPGPQADKLAPRLSQTARLLYLVYTLYSVILLLLLLAGGMPLFEALAHTWGTIGTAGFSPLNQSIGSYAIRGHENSLYFETVITIFMFLAGANFALHYQFLKGNFKVYFKDAEFKVYFFITFIAIGLIAWDLGRFGHYSSFEESLRHSAFATIAIFTTTGFGTVDFNEWPTFSKFTLLFLMFSGACSGSTSGGIKIIRIIALAKEGFRQLRLTVSPRGSFSVRMGKVSLNDEMLNAMNSFVILFILIYILGILILATTNLDFETIASMAIAALANIGPGLGAVGPTANYDAIPEFAKWFLSFLMLLGRLELLPVLALFHPRIWKV